ncbi:cytoskeletal protein RodZ [alpha proteobacterium Q-1]|uniref:helix-turn-helix domain-containing protein n=1 Tax=Iodidimonas nitroreducens TaxID=1236968 RepID=UPI0004A1536A|nr:helix-turn-helix domain-containing protein [Iodidimonas nitroreducens]GAK34185.1 cytoskeletal protein RodZ [alpha proteobacterium Q-1]
MTDERQSKMHELSQADDRSPDTGGSDLSVGHILQKARLAQGRSLEESAAELKIKSRYLAALEDGRYGDMPPPAFSAGFVRSYAVLFGLDGQALAQSFRREAGAVNEQSHLHFPEPVADSRLPGRAVLLAGSAGMLAIYFGWIADFGTISMAESQVDPVPHHLTAHLTDRAADGKAVAAGLAVDAALLDQAQKSNPEAPGDQVSQVIASAVTKSVPAGEAAGGSSSAEQSRISGDAKPEPTVESASPDAGSGDDGAALLGSRLVLQARSDAWLYIVDDANREVWNGVLRTGERWSPPSGRSGLRLMTSNAGALRILVDGEELSALGKAGDVVRDVSLNPDRLKKREKLALR